MVVGLGSVGWFLVAPHANAKVTNNPIDGGYSVTATPGLGYQYRWSFDGKPQSKDFGDDASISFNLDFDKERQVGLEVKNAFGQVATHKFALKRPKPDMSGLTTIDVQRGANGQLQGTPRPGGALGMPVRPGALQAPPIPQGAKLPPGHPAIPQGQ
jgi:hypothetical protein